MFITEPLGDIRCELQMHLRHRIGVIVVVDDRCIFIRAGDGIDAEAAAVGAVKVAEAHPDACGVQHDLGAMRQQEGVVAGGLDIELDGMRDVGTAWWISISAGAALVITVLAVNLVADGLRAALNARQLPAR